jgi:RNA polymerase sigma-70 factor, ECF subfamily
MPDAAERLYERVLVVRCQTGDEGAFALLIARYARRLRFYLRKLVGDAPADDLLQDVWLDVFAKLARLRDPGAFGAWAYRIARDKAYAELARRRIPHAPLDAAGASADVEDFAADEESDDAWSTEDVERVRAGLDELPRDHREVLVLRFVEDMTYEQIAAVIGRPVGTVRSRVHYAKQSLRAVLGRPPAGKDELT